eukprot:g47988.t1
MGPDNLWALKTCILELAASPANLFQSSNNTFYLTIWKFAQGMREDVFGSGILLKLSDKVENNPFNMKSGGMKSEDNGEPITLLPLVEEEAESSQTILVGNGGIEGSDIHSEQELVWAREMETVNKAEGIRGFVDVGNGFVDFGKEIEADSLRFRDYKVRDTEWGKIPRDNEVGDSPGYNGLMFGCGVMVRG